MLFGLISQADRYGLFLFGTTDIRWPLHFAIEVVSIVHYLWQLLFV